MKKLTAFLLAMLFTCGTMISCDKDASYEVSKGNETTQSETSAQTEDVMADYDQDDSQQGFSIKGKTYYYKGNSFYDHYYEYSAGDVLLLTVTNETKIDYEVTVKVTFLDENGEAVNTQSKSFDQYIAGYTNYFLFQSHKEYASYTCDLSLTEISKEKKDDIIVDNLTLTYGGMREKIEPDPEKLFFEGVFNEVPVILARTGFEITGEIKHKNVACRFILFDNTGVIHLISSFSFLTFNPPASDHYVYIEREHRSKVNLPEELKGELVMLEFPVSIIDPPSK